MRARVGKRFQHVHFAREFIGIAATAVHVQHETVFERKFTVARQAPADEFQLAQVFIPADEPEIQAARRCVAGFETGRHVNTVGDRGAVQFRSIPAHHWPGLFGPRRMSRAQLFDAIFSGSEQLFRGVDFPDFLRLRVFVKHVVFDREAHRVVKNLDIGQQFKQRRFALQFHFQRFDIFAQSAQSALQFRFHGLGQRYFLGRNFGRLARAQT